MARRDAATLPRVAWLSARGAGRARRRDRRRAPDRADADRRRPRPRVRSGLPRRAQGLRLPAAARVRVRDHRRRVVRRGPALPGVDPQPAGVAVRARREHGRLARSGDRADRGVRLRSGSGVPGKLPRDRPDLRRLARLGRADPVGDAAALGRRAQRVLLGRDHVREPDGRAPGPGPHPALADRRPPGPLRARDAPRERRVRRRDRGARARVVARAQPAVALRDRRGPRRASA